LSERLGRHDVPFAPVQSIEDVIEDPQVKHLGIVVPVVSPHAGARAVRPPVQFSGQRSEHVGAAPLLDEQGAAIRAALAGGGGWPSMEVLGPRTPTQR
jgi:crotonobetainyl-CoA:carnitine CoA-transferase CaiB-like acyl-CoA transferase